MLRDVLENYSFNDNVVKIDVNNQGNINSTYILTFSNGKKCLLQRINTEVFKNPNDVMENITNVTKYMNSNPCMKSVLDIVNTRDGKSLCTVTDKNGSLQYYRCYEYIENCISYDSVSDAVNADDIVYNAGYAFGLFHKSLDGFDCNSLHTVIPKFHDTRSRYDDLLASIEKDPVLRACKFENEFMDLSSHLFECTRISSYLGRKLPVRVTHNDTKLNNVLIDKYTGEVVAVVDLDTLMPGSVLYDIGDGIRSSCSASFEDETDRNKIYLDMNLTRSYLRGYLDVMYDTLTEDEINNIGLSIETLTFELAVRFLTDYINGDIYFKIKYEEHNAVRFMNQYLLWKDIVNKREEIQTFVNDYVTLKKHIKTR